MSHPNPSTALARTFVDELVRNEVSLFVLSPGSRSAALAIAAVSHPGAEVVVAIDERSAGFYAVGAGRAGRVAAVVVTSGTAVANLYPAVVEASMSSVPVVFLTADRPPELIGVGANQTIDQSDVFGVYPRLSRQLGPAEDHPGSNALWRSSVCSAVGAATGSLGRPGPVHLDLPFREPVVPSSSDGRSSVQPFRSETTGRPDAEPWTRVPPVARVGEPLPASVASVGRGVVVAGAGADVDWCDRAAAELGWPLVAEAAAGRRPPQAISTAHFLARVGRVTDELTPVITIEVGRVGLSRPLAEWLRRSRRVVIDPGRWTDRHRDAEIVFPAYPVVDPPEPMPRDADWRRRWLELERAARAALDDALDAEPGMVELRIARDAARAATGSVLVAGSSMPIRDLDAVLEPDSPPILANRGASGIDGFVSTVLGVAQVTGAAVALGGDLSMLHDQNGFLVDRRPDAVFVVVDNDGGGIFSFLPQAEHAGEHFERVFGTPHGRSFERYAGLHGLEYHPVTDPGQLTGTVRDSIGKGLHLVHVRTDRAENVAAHRRIAATVEAALTG